VSTSDGQLCNAAILNGAYLSKVAGGTTIGVIVLNHSGSGAQVTNLQQKINDLIAADVALDARLDIVEPNVKKNNYTTTSPSVNDDSGDGYAVGSQWFNSTLKRAFVCVDATAGAAIWRRIDMIPLKIVDKYVHDFSSTNVTDAAYVEIDNSTGFTIKSIQAFYPDGDALIIATGAASSEVDLGYIFPGGSGTNIDCDIPAGTRLSMKLISGGETNVEGKLVINVYGEA
jgi:hypothetical protein